MKLVVPGRKTINCKYLLVFQTCVYWIFGVKCAELLDVLTRVIFNKKKPHRRDMWVPVTTAWRILRLRIEERLRFGG